MPELHEEAHAAVSAAPGDDKKTEKQAELLLTSARAAGARFVHTNESAPYALINVPGMNASQVLLIRSSRFRAFLSHLYHQKERKTPSRGVVNDALAVMEGVALFEGPEVDIHLRYRADDESIDIDLGDRDYQMIHITAEGWSLQPHAGVYFRRPAAMLPMPKPSSDGTKLDALKPFINADDRNFLRILIFAVCAMRGRGPFPILPLHGEQGSAKTTAGRILKALIDPGKLDSRAPSRDTHDLAIAADNSYMLVFDNLSEMAAPMADAFCRLSTGGSFTTRTLYTDREEEVFEGQRPQVFTSIEDLMVRPDLADRMIPGELVAISDDARRPEDQLWAEFRKAQPRLLGALLDALVIAFNNLAQVRAGTKMLPRMADAYLWSLAAESAFGCGDGVSVAEAWRCAREDAVASALEASVIAAPLLALLDLKISSPGGTWEVTAGEALRQLNASLANEAVEYQRTWPRNGKSLMNKLKRIGSALRAKGYTFAQSNRTAKSRLWCFSRGEGAPPERGNVAQSSSPSSSSQAEQAQVKPDDAPDANDKSARSSAFRSNGVVGRREQTLPPVPPAPESYKWREDESTHAASGAGVERRWARTVADALAADEPEAAADAERLLQYADERIGEAGEDTFPGGYTWEDRRGTRCATCGLGALCWLTAAGYCCRECIKRF